ncbi:Helix-turn-helix domain-containing protein [Bryocella elongata]|uniref:Helix-turn-helix domain-containing protein n=1 Tax=Bryocella elongata TaxID=863522 RepID=A0A1H5WUV1_9BACT|nr:AraC family transcriptional regulator [Bryocella elongata]SEG03093.1 Helix-turn-helix domain-containing protein [Bryocella elongata]
MDRLNPFFARFTLSVRVFFSGHICGTTADHVTKSAGHLHVLRSGVLSILNPAGAPTVLREPTVLLYPRPGEHTFQTEGADIVCAFVDFGAGTSNPLIAALPRLLSVPLSSAPELTPTVDLLFAEAFSQREGRQVAVDRLAEYFLVILLRHALESHIIQGGILTALSDKHLASAVSSMHQHPERSWSLEELAHIAGMSRARFAAHFLTIMGQTPFEYLVLWRIAVAQSLLRKGEPLKMIAPAVGYASAAALNRAFTLHMGMPPMSWLAAQQPASIP